MKEQTPYVFIGIGGIGCRIVASISDKLDISLRDHAGFIGIDMDAHEMMKLKSESHYMKLIQLGGDNQSIRDYLEKYPEAKDWFPKEDIIRFRNPHYGSGQIRAVSRLLFHDAAVSGKLNPIIDEIDRVSFFGTPVIVIVGTIAGGTGSGMVIELPFFIREYFERSSSKEQFYIRGMFIGPDLVEPLQHYSSQRKRVRANSYACLKELNALNMHHLPMENEPDELARNISLDNYDHDNSSFHYVPYNMINLFEGLNEYGTIGRDGIYEICNQISDIAYYSCFSEANNLLLHIEDSCILSKTLKNNCLNKFVGTGLCKIVFPRERVLDYVSRVLLNEVINDGWLEIDRRFEHIKTESDANKTVLSKQDFYKTEFENEAIAKADEGLFNQYVDEAFTKLNTKYVSKAELFLNDIKDHVSELLESEDFVRSVEDCKVNDENMDSFDSAYYESYRVFGAMIELTRLAKNFEIEISRRIKKEVFPISINNSDDLRNSDNSIYGMLATVNPVVARYLIYDLIVRLQRLSEETEFYREYDLYGFKDYDFDPSKEGIQAPYDVIKEKEAHYRPIMRFLGCGEKKAISDVRRQLLQVSDYHINSVKEYLYNKVLNKLSRILLSRLQMLSQIYEEFFTNLKKCIKYNEDLLEELIEPRFPFYVKSVYCSETALKKMLYDYKCLNNNYGVLSNQTNKSIFNKLFSVFKNEYQIEGFETSSYFDTQNGKEAERVFDSIFDKDLVLETRKFVYETGKEVFDLSVIEAIENEYDLSNATEPMDIYIGNMFNNALKIASPLLCVDKNQIDNHKYCIVLASSSLTEGERLLIKTFDHDLIDVIHVEAKRDSVREDELVCLRADYCYLIENLKLYGSDSCNACAYEEIISDNGKSDELQITPHLNRFWHEEGFIPSIHPECRKIERENVFKAFILGLGFDCFIKVPYKDKIDVDGKRVVKWASSVGSSFPEYIYKQDELIGESFMDLYNSLWFNGAIKKAVLKYSHEMFLRFKALNAKEVIETKVMDFDFILDLIQVDTDNDHSEERNIYDIFLSMFPFMKAAEWECLMYSLRDILWEFFALLFEGNENLIDRKTKEVLKAAYNHSMIMSYAELSGSMQKLMQIHERVLLENYHRF